jgi:hypothetical protein
MSGILVRIKQCAMEQQYGSTQMPLHFIVGEVEVHRNTTLIPAVHLAQFDHAPCFFGEGLNRFAESRQVTL